LSVELFVELSVELSVEVSVELSVDLVCGLGLWTLSVDLEGHVPPCTRLRKKKIKSFEGLQTQPSPLSSEKAATTHNVSSIILNIYLNIFIYLFIYLVCC